MTEERSRLRPIKVAPADLALRIPVSVGPTGVVMHDGQRDCDVNCDVTAPDRPLLTGFDGVLPRANGGPQVVVAQQLRYQSV